ncbi:MAG: carbonate dehydratase [Verrucomicrobia bacterium]|nr:MAG: carbonate dehydratase [Verrucomicrobiota bacterium]TAE89195.1 MAG: carbonate dehydratase [Verrucomicrobiota bacterium]TAF27929.1 MAG: carbonate dehydratase [Verrucomicrobiota bacterium]TAF42778.1 MAG: carbonate dehydratase [Verrucomicrobiota bacterium]
MESLTHLLENNRLWAESQVAVDPQFFTRLANQQSPEYLWIGCSDSRVPANQITGLAPGEIFVHRNVANVVVQTDFNMLSVLQFAVDVLKVKHVIVCGHYGCGGVRAALENQRHGIVDNWLRHIRNTARRAESELNGLVHENAVDRLCELNVLANAQNLARTTIVEDAWERGQPVDIHSWIYRLDSGRINVLADPIRS